MTQKPNENYFGEVNFRNMFKSSTHGTYRQGLSMLVRPWPTLALVVFRSGLSIEIKQKTTITPADLMPAEKRLIELGFVEKNGKRLKIKLELVRLWLIEKNPLPNNKQRKPKEGRKKIKRHRTSSQPNRPNPVAQFIAFIALISVIVFIGQKLLSRIHSSKNYERFQSDCYRLSEEISNALEEKKDTTQLQVIKKVRTEWSREKKGLLDKQCPYSYELDAKYNALLQYY